MNRLQERIRQLPPGVEFLIVITWAFGLSIIASILSLGVASTEPVFSNEALIGGTVESLAVTLLLVWFLRIRGWTLERVGFEVSVRGTLWGVALLAGIYGFIIAVEVIAQLLGFDMDAAVASYPTADTLNMQVVVVASVVNGAYEEIFVAGYVITMLSAARGPWTAINVSTGLRVLYHLYQGPLGVLTIVPMGLMFGYIYVRTRKLWPVIVAHVLMDVIGLALASRS
jgi:membrane protease YdiL (CAAX protease family)